MATELDGEVRMAFFWFRNRMGSGQRAKERLLAAIAYDRFWLSSAAEEALRQEMMAVLYKYLPLEAQSQVRLEIREEGGEVFLAFRIPRT